LSWQLISIFIHLTLFGGCFFPKVYQCMKRPPTNGTNTSPIKLPDWRCIKMTQKISIAFCIQGNAAQKQQGRPYGNALSSCYLCSDRTYCTSVIPYVVENPKKDNGWDYKWQETLYNFLVYMPTVSIAMLKLWVSWYVRIVPMQFQSHFAPPNQSQEQHMIHCYPAERTCFL